MTLPFIHIPEFLPWFVSGNLPRLVSSGLPLTRLIWIVRFDFDNSCDLRIAFTSFDLDIVFLVSLET